MGELCCVDGAFLMRVFCLEGAINNRTEDFQGKLLNLGGLHKTEILVGMYFVDCDPIMQCLQAQF